MSTQSEILYVADMARVMGRTESAIRMGVARGVEWLPKPMQGMGRRLSWLRDDVEQFIKSRSGSGSAATRRRIESE